MTVDSTEPDRLSDLPAIDRGKESPVALAKVVRRTARGWRVDRATDILSFPCVSDEPIAHPAHLQLGAGPEGDYLWCDRGCDPFQIELGLLTREAAGEQYGPLTVDSAADHGNGADEPERSPFADVGAVLDGGLSVPAPDGGPARTDGERILYRGRVNALIGDPESAKTLFALTVVADELAGGGVAVVVDTDHNGIEAVLRFLLALGVPSDVLRDPRRFRYAEPDDRDELLRAVAAVADELSPGVVVLDSLGENLGLWGVSSNDDQGFLEMNRATAVRLAKVGHLVVTIDHFAKNADSRAYGATGTTAKKRAVNGAMFEVVVVDEFSPTTGGRSALLLRKDRQGGVRGLGHKRGDTVAIFELSAPDPTHAGQQTWRLVPGLPTAVAKAAAAASRLDADVLALDALIPPPTSKEDVRKRLSWRSDRAMLALREWRARQQQAAATTPGTAAGGAA